ncbi:MAG TPA: Mur ligase domain-containing protein, partial [Candidatus Dormibacteraeota bacterium]|nr:Mur ligase domain-containing protein [Candidatus Dormibacteraeota bacterium]
MTRVHLLGVGGAAMSALANLYLDRGDSVSGSDAEASETTRALAEIGAEVRIGHAAANVGQAELVVTSTAVPDDNPELAEARRRGIPVLHRSRAAAELLRGLRQVAVAGTHGKTTTTTLCAAVLGPLDPTVLSGGRLPGSRFNSRPGAGRWAVVEADESDRSFLALAPQIGVVTNVEADHLDHFRDLGEIMAAFEEFATRVGGTLVGCADDPGAVEVLAAAPGDVLTYGFGPADVRGFDYTPGGGGSVFGVETPWGAVQATLPLPGPHNARNAL